MKLFMSKVSTKTIPKTGNTIATYNLADHNIKKTTIPVLTFSFVVHCPKNYKVDLKNIGLVWSKIHSDEVHELCDKFFPKSKGFTVSDSFSRSQEKVAVVETKKKLVRLPNIKSTPGL